MDPQVRDLVDWLNSFDDYLIGRLGGQPFVEELQPEGFYQIKNNLGVILVRPDMFSIFFNSGGSYLSTVLPGQDWVSPLKAEIHKHKIFILLSVLPASQKLAPVSWRDQLFSLWTWGHRLNPLSWTNLTKPEVLELVLPYFQSQKQAWREGKLREYPAQQFQEMISYLQQVKSCPEVGELMGLLE